ncbi:unnamed protein product [Urochloa humidicola]
MRLKKQMRGRRREIELLCFPKRCFSETTWVLAKKKKILIPLGKEQRILSIGMSWNIEVSCIVKKNMFGFFCQCQRMERIL